jgi:DNA polymerase III delta subunit
VTAVLNVVGPRNAGPGEREAMLQRARAWLEEGGVARDAIVRVDVPERGSGEEGGGTLRVELEIAVPVLQSASLFGDRQGLLLVDAQWITAAEGEALAGLLQAMDPDAVLVVFVTVGSLPALLAKTVKAVGGTETVKKAREWEMERWLAGEAERRALTLDKAAAIALIQHFGTDTASLGRALDQLVGVRGKVTAESVHARFTNRPDEPVYLYTDAVEKGDVGEALRRLGDALVHQHPLVIVAALENQVRRTALAASAPDLGTFVEWVGARSSDRWTERMWRNRGRVPDSALRLSIEAIVRADRTLKTEPEETHRVTMERLTVALCRWSRRR